MDTDKAAYERVRALRPTRQADRAARFLYLNRLAFNGLYRVNRNGEFNVPYAGDKRMDYFWRTHRLKEASEALKKAKLVAGDFSLAMSHVGQGAFVYCDPVYASSQPRELFDRYTAPPFGAADGDRLVGEIRQAVSRGATVVVSWPWGESLPGGAKPDRLVRVTGRSTIHASAKKAAVIEEALAIFGE